MRYEKRNTKYYIKYYLAEFKNNDFRKRYFRKETEILFKEILCWCGKDSLGPRKTPLADSCKHGKLIVGLHRERGICWPPSRALSSQELSSPKLFSSFISDGSLD